MVRVNVLTRSPPPQVRESCLRRRLRLHPCDACAQACPTAAITLRPDGASLDSERCVRCGRCLFSCPVAALENLAPPPRYLRDNVLVAPLSAVAPSVEELLMWHREHAVRAVEMDMDRHPGWALAVAALNLRLRRLGEPCWTRIAPDTATHSGWRWRRGASAATTTASVSPGRRARRRCFAEQAEWQPEIDERACTLCGACARVCLEGALRMDAGTLEIAPGNCTGCQSCVVVCIVQAMVLEPGADVSPRRRHWYTARCQHCHQPFRAWQPDAPVCPLCQRHAQGMRTAR